MRVDFVSKPGKKGTEYPDNLFNTWLEYRVSKGDNQASIIREVNDALNRKYDNNTFYRWKKQQLSIPDLLIKQFINPELADILEWLFKTKKFSNRKMRFDTLAKAIQPPIKITE